MRRLERSPFSVNCACAGTCQDHGGQKNTLRSINLKLHCCIVLILWLHGGQTSSACLNEFAKKAVKYLPNKKETYLRKEYSTIKAQTFHGFFLVTRQVIVSFQSPNFLYNFWTFCWSFVDTTLFPVFRMEAVDMWTFAGVLFCID